MNLEIEYEQEEDGRWLAEIPSLPGVMGYGETAQQAVAKVELLALKILAERIEENEYQAIPIHLSFTAFA